MTREEKRTLYGDCVLSVILGNGSNAHRIAAGLFVRYGVTSVLCDRRMRLLNVLNYKCGFLQLIDPQEQRLTVEQLLSVAEEREEYILLLIPSTEEYREFIKGNSELLESHFIIVSSEAELNKLPLFSPRPETVSER